MPLIQPWWIDAILIIITVLYVIDGVRRGFFLVAFEVVGFFLSLFLAFLLYVPAGKLILHFWDIPHSFANAIAFFAIWIGAGLAYPFAVKRLYKRIPSRYIENKWNRYTGVIPAFLDAVVLAAVVLPLLVVLPLPGAVKSAVLKSRIGAPIARGSEKFNQQIDAVFSPAVRESLGFLTVHPKSNESVELKFKTEKFTVDEESEAELFRLANVERAKEGLPMVKYNARLRDLARKHGEDMLRRGYFSHITPEGKTPGDRADAAGFPYNTLGENLAFAPDVTYAHDGLMNSPGHRANILSPDFGRLGVGVLDAGIYGKMFVQAFAD